MKVILLQDVKSLGKKGDLVKVSDGYARNMLLPKKLGVEATPKALNDLKLRNAHEEKVAREALSEAQDLAEKIGKSTLEMKIKVGEGGRAFGSISAKEIAEAAKEQFGFDIDKKKIQLAAPIKELGFADVPVKLHRQVTANLKIHVTEA
ncbi:MAG: 50S ribosomal protein L9 [Bilifractor sp.]|jgi:large subunit ribosomal protein L9